MITCVRHLFIYLEKFGPPILLKISGFKTSQAVIQVPNPQTKSLTYSCLRLLERGKYFIWYFPLFYFLLRLPPIVGLEQKGINYKSLGTIHI